MTESVKEYLRDEEMECYAINMEAENPEKDPSSSGRYEEMLISVINATTVYVDWCPAIHCDGIHGYKVRYCVKNSVSYTEVFVTPGISNYTLSGLAPNTEYVISVDAVNENDSVIQECGWGTHKTGQSEGVSVLHEPSVNSTSEFLCLVQVADSFPTGISGGRRVIVDSILDLHVP